MPLKMSSEARMNIEDELGNIDVVILCGGRGERLRPVLKELPKVLAKVGEQAILDLVIDNVLQYGFNRIILSVGYLKEHVIRYFNSRRQEGRIQYRIEFSEEDTPLGTGGAIKRSQPLIQSRSFLVLNGDSICNIDFGGFYRFHREKRGLLSLVVVKAEKGEAGDYGSVRLDDSGRITSFREKAGQEMNGLISAGAYFMRDDMFSHMRAETCFSLEYEFFPMVLDEGCYGFYCESELIDIGTPERYEKANTVLCGPTLKWKE